jgi:hypothetical protein
MRFLPILLALLVPANAVAQGVAEQDGSLFYRASADAAARQITPAEPPLGLTSVPSILHAAALLPHRQPAPRSPRYLQRPCRT